MSSIPVTLVWFTHFPSNGKREFVVQENKVFFVKKSEERSLVEQELITRPEYTSLSSLVQSLVYCIVLCSVDETCCIVLPWVRRNVTPVKIQETEDVKLSRGYCVTLIVHLNCSMLIQPNDKISTSFSTTTENKVIFV
jgi:hypothetical protein